MVSVQSNIANQAQNRALWKDQVSDLHGKDFGVKESRFSKTTLASLGFSELRGATLKNAKTTAAFINSQELFKSYVRTEVRAMTDGMSASHAQEFTMNAEARLDGIVKSTFGTMEDRLLAGKSISSPAKHMKEANKLAESFLAELGGTSSKTRIDDMRADLAHRAAPGVPQVVCGRDGTINLVRTAPLIENLVLKGGGAKGIGYPPALREMADAGLLGGLKKVVGTSAGALTAVSLACGQTSDELKALADQDIRDLLKSDKKVGEIYPELSFQGQLGGAGIAIRSYVGGGDAQGMVQTLDKVSGDKAKDFLVGVGGDLRNLADDYALASGQDADKLFERLQTLRAPDYGTDRSGKMVTFADMKMLHAMEPKLFKEIELTGYDATAKEGKMFNATETPDLPVAFGARISMAHPAIATAVTISKYGLEGHKFADGGISSNSPTEAIYGSKAEAARDSAGDAALQEAHARTAIMFFDEKGKAYTALHGLPSERTSGAGKATAWAVDNPNMSADKQADKDKEYASGPNAFVVFHGKIGTKDVAPSQQDKDMAEALSTLKTLEQINNRKDEAYAVEVDSIAAGYTLLTDQEREAIRLQGAPNRNDFKGSTAEANFEAATELFKLASGDFNRGLS